MEWRRTVGGVLLAGLLMLIIVGFGLGEVSRHVTNSADLDAVRDLAGDRTRALTSIAEVLSVLGRTVVIIPLALVAAAVLARFHSRTDAVFLILSVAGALIIFNADKVLVERPRPPLHHLQAASNWSFPSGHATTSSAFYLALALVLPAATLRSRLLAVTAATVLVAGIAFSRVYLAVHYPTDVAGGIVLGTAWCLLAHRVVCGDWWAMS